MVSKGLAHFIVGQEKEEHRAPMQKSNLKLKQVDLSHISDSKMTKVSQDKLIKHNDELEDLKSLYNAEEGTKFDKSKMKREVAKKSG